MRKATQAPFLLKPVGDVLVNTLKTQGMFSGRKGSVVSEKVTLLQKMFVLNWASAIRTNTVCGGLQKATVSTTKITTENKKQHRS
mmetsp:Transcript_89020/g.236462  ORF Transcript_89020/g.236462 Transcript_89020/m.236462 type:complete len:85 (+) Transcript_89020:354-608(+)